MQEIKNYKIDKIINALMPQLTNEEKEHLNVISIFDTKDLNGNKKSDGILDIEEYTNFLYYLKEKCQNLFNKMQKCINNESKINVSKKNSASQMEETATKIKIAEFINTARKTLSDKEKKSIPPPLSEKEIKRWTDLIYENSKKYKIAPELLTTILVMECGFQHKQLNKNTKSYGPMQAREISVQDFTKGAANNRNNTYQLFAKDLLNDIEKHMKKIGKKNTVSNILQECVNNDDFGIKVGITIFKMKCLEAINRKNISNAIEKVKNSTVLNNKEYIRKAIQSYSGNDQSYVKKALQILNTLGFDYEHII